MAFISESSVALPAMARRAGGYAIAAFGLLLATSAGAAAVETLSTVSTYTYDFVPGLPGANSGTGDNGIFHVIGPDPLKATDIKINYGTVTASDSSFFFLHNIQCKGYCSIGVKTVLVDTITNTGADTINLRLDSDITAGHLGLVQNAKTGSSGIFQFDITQTANGVDSQLYQALGQVSSSGATINTSDGSVFAGLSSYQDPAQIGLDWDTTDLSVLLAPLAPGETTTVTYTSFTYLNSFGSCVNADLCDGVQVAFGDPRNNGGIINIASGLMFESSAMKEPFGWVLDRGFDMATVKLNVVNVSDAPEPASWAMMLMGFGMTGMAVRRRAGPKLAAA
jgi:hypothetical protein